MQIASHSKRKVTSYSKAMMMTTVLPYVIVPYPYFNENPIYVGRAAGTSWCLQPNWVGNTLPTLEVQRYDACGKFKIDITLNYTSSYYAHSKHHRNVTKYIVDGQKTAKIKTMLPLQFEQWHEEVTGIIIIRECRNNPSSLPDAILSCGETKIPVHSLTLSIRSSVFADMFKNKIQERMSGIFTIEDLEVNTLQAMLKYIYSGRIDNLTNLLAIDLLMAAEKYQLKDLKLTCVNQLKFSLKVNNVFSILLLGDSLDHRLKDYAKEFVCKFNKFSVLQNTEEWNSLRKNHPDLAIELLTFVIKYLQRN